MSWCDRRSKRGPAPWVSRRRLSAAEILMAWGVHGGLPGTYPYDGTISFGGKSNWWLVKTIESYNGIINSGQGNFEGFFNPSCAGGFLYSRTPIGMVCHTDEP